MKDCFCLGFRLSNRTFSALVMRYSSKDGNVEFGDFILCAIRMKTMLGENTFQSFYTRNFVLVNKWWWWCAIKLAHKKVLGLNNFDSL